MLVVEVGYDLLVALCGGDVKIEATGRIAPATFGGDAVAIFDEAATSHVYRGFSGWCC